LACRDRGAPKILRCDNGTEFVAKPLDQWAFWNKIALDFSRPGKPTGNAFSNRSTEAFAGNCLIHRTLNQSNRPAALREYGATSTMGFDRTQCWLTKCRKSLRRQHRSNLEADFPTIAPVY